MTAGAAPAPAQTHGCARCGAPVALDVGLCERCNPLAIAAHLAVAGIGPFSAKVTGVTAGSAPGSIVASVQVRNDGRSAGSATCRLDDPRDASLVNSVVVFTPRIEPGSTVSFEQAIPGASVDRTPTITCTGP